MSKYKAKGRDISLLDTVEECAKVIKTCTSILHYGVDNQDLVQKLTKEALKCGQEIENLLLQLPKPSINYMSKIVEGWFTNSTERDRMAFSASTYEELAVYHHTIGQEIRNHFNLWNYQWEPEMVDGVDMSPQHPDAVSMEVIRTVWRKVKDQ